MSQTMHELTTKDRRERAAVLWSFNKASAGPKATLKTCAMALGLPNTNKEEENIPQVQGVAGG